MLLWWLAAAPRPVPLTLLRHAQPLLCDEAAPSPLTPAYMDTDFDRALNGILADAAKMGMEPALDSWLERLDDVFIPTLAGRLEASAASGAAELPQLTALFEALQLRTSSRFERAREQLQTLLTAGEINDMNAQLIRLVKNDEIDAGFVYVLLRNIEDAEKKGEEPMVRLLSHLHTVTHAQKRKRAGGRITADGHKPTARHAARPPPRARGGPARRGPAPGAGEPIDQSHENSRRAST